MSTEETLPPISKDRTADMLGGYLMAVCDMVLPFNIEPHTRARMMDAIESYVNFRHDIASGDICREIILEQDHKVSDTFNTVRACVEILRRLPLDDKENV